MADRLTIEHYVGECFIKCSQVILSSRIYMPNPGPPKPPDRRASRWFLLEVDEVDGVAKDVEPWRRDISSPMVIEVYVQPWGTRAVVTSADGADQATPAGEMLLERWTLQYVRGTAPGSGGGPSSSNSSSSSGGRTYLDDSSVYKRMILLVRSLYSYCRVLPAYRMYRTCKRYQGDLVRLRYRIHRGTPPPPHPGGAGALTHPGGPAAAGDPGRLQHFLFAPVDTPGGQMRVSVQYQPAVTVHILEQQQGTAPIAMPRIINDYYMKAGGGGPGVAASAPVSASAPGMAGRPTGRGMPPAVGTHAHHEALKRRTGHDAHHTAIGFNSPPADTSMLRRNQSARPGVDAGLGPGSGAGMGSGAGPGAAGGPSSGGGARQVVRHSWSSKEMKVSFALPPPLGSPGNSFTRRTSSGYGSTPSTPPMMSPVMQHATGRPPLPVGGAHGGSGGGVGSLRGPSAPGTLHHLHPHLNRNSSGGGSGATQHGGAPTGRVSSGGSGTPEAGVTRGSIAASPQHSSSALVARLGTAVAVSPFTSAAAGHQRMAAEAACDGGAAAGAAPGEGSGAAAAAAGGGEADARDKPSATSQAAADCGGPSGPCTAAAGMERQATSNASAPVSIPGKHAARTRSVTDLPAAAVYGGFQVDPSVAAALAKASGTAGQGHHHAAAGNELDPSELAAIQRHLAPGSAPAAPRGMLGLALLGAGGNGGNRAAAGGTGAGAIAVAAGSCRRADAAAPLVVDQEAPVPLLASSSAAAGRGRSSASGSDDGSASLRDSDEHAKVGPGSGPGSVGPHSNALAIVNHHRHQHHHNAGHHHPPAGGQPAPTHMTVTQIVPLPQPSPPAYPFPPPWLPPGSVGGSVAGSLPAYGSPQLPFAFTPGGQSLASLHQAMVPMGYFGSMPLGAGVAPPDGGGGTAPGAVSGRDITALATIRRPSWSSKSSSFEPAGGTALAPSGGAMSPLRLLDPLDEGLMSEASTPRQQPTMFSFSPCTSPVAVTLAAPVSADGAVAGGAAAGQQHQGRPRRREGPGSGEGAGGGARRPKQRQQGSAASAMVSGGSADASATAAPALGDTSSTSGCVASRPGSEAHRSLSDPDHPDPDQDPDALLGGLLGREESESDLLPFALDQEGLMMAVSPGGREHGSGVGMRCGVRPTMEMTLSIAQAQERDVAVGAFVRMMQEAPPLALPQGAPGCEELAAAQALAEIASLADAIKAALHMA